MITILAAVNREGVIGKDGTIPWNNKEDLARFKELTTGNTIIMGRKTWDSLPVRPLPNRTNIVITSRNSSDFPHNVIVVRSLEQAVEAGHKIGRDIFLIGGQRVLEDGMEYADRLDITLIYDESKGDTHFKPVIKHDEWGVVDLKVFAGGQYTIWDRIWNN